MAEQPNANDLQQRYRQFLELAPLTVALAGLPTSGARLYGEEQAEARAVTARLAFKVARALADEVSAGDAQKYRQFLDLLPLAVSLSGLPPSEGRLFSEDQLEARAITVRAAYRVARNTAKECLGGS